MVNSLPEEDLLMPRSAFVGKLVALSLILLIAAFPAVAAQQSGEAKAAAPSSSALSSKAAPPDVEARLKAMGIELPTPSPPSANFVRAVRSGNLVFLAGHGPSKPGGGYVKGRLGENLTIEQGYEASRFAAIALLASLKAEIGDLDKVTRIVKVTGMVNSTPAFTDQSSVVNGCSDFLVELFGEAIGKHARAAVGMASLPIGFAVEIEMIVEVAP